MSEIQKILLENIDQEIEVVLIKEKQFNLDSFVRGYHAYMDIWVPKVGDKNLSLKLESENLHDKYAVAVLSEGRVFGHVPKNLSKLFHQFLRIPNSTIGCKITGKRVNRGAGYGLEIPAEYSFIGAVKAVEWVEKNINKLFVNLSEKINKCMK